MSAQRNAHNPVAWFVLPARSIVEIAREHGSFDCIADAVIVPAVVLHFAFRDTQLPVVSRIHRQEQPELLPGFQAEPPLGISARRRTILDPFARLRSERTIGSKAYHAEVFAEGPYPIEQSRCSGIAR